MIAYPSTSTEVDKLIPLLIAARNNIKTIGKDRGATGKAQFEYANIEKIIDAVVPILYSHNLFLTFNEIRFDDGVFALETKIFEPGGQFIRTTARVNEPLYFANPKKSAEQIYGGILTYCKRYGVANLLGLKIGEDDPEDAKPDEKNEDVHGEQEQSSQEPKKQFTIKEDGTPITPSQLSLLERIFQNPTVQSQYPSEYFKLKNLTKAEASILIGKVK